MKKGLILLLAVFLLLSGCGSADSNQADGEKGSETVDLLDEIRERGYITIGTEGTYSPNSYHNEADELVGFDVEVGRKIAEKLGVEARFVETEWNSLFAAMDAERIDIICNEVEYSDERALKYDFSTPYTYVHGALLVREDNSDISGFEDLQGKKAAQNLSSSWGQLAESYGAEVVGVSAMSESIELILSGRADATLNAETAFGDYMRNHPDQKVKVAALSEDTVQSVVPVRKGNDSLLEAINAALEEMRQSGELQELSEKYFGIDVTHE